MATTPSPTSVPLSLDNLPPEILDNIWKQYFTGYEIGYFHYVQDHEQHSDLQERWRVPPWGISKRQYRHSTRAMSEHATVVVDLYMKKNHSDGFGKLLTWLERRGCERLKSMERAKLKTFADAGQLMIDLKVAYDLSFILQHGDWPGVRDVTPGEEFILATSWNPYQDTGLTFETVMNMYLFAIPTLATRPRHAQEMLWACFDAMFNKPQAQFEVIKD